MPKGQTLRELIGDLRDEVRAGFADLARRLDAIEAAAARPKVARALDPAARFQDGGGNGPIQR
jgi:hypothetical protein